MTTTELKEVESQVLDWIQDAGRPVSTTELLEEHRSSTPVLPGEVLRRAVWNLVDRGVIKYDFSWRLAPVIAESR
jgi:hypothetical protein